MLSPEQRQSYRDQGCLIITDLFTAEECEEINRHARDIVEGRIRLELPTEIRMEPDAEEQGLVTEVNRYDYLFKIGHHMHQCDPLFRRYACHPRLASVLQEIIGPDVKCVQTMYIDKPPRLGVGQPYHQDSHYLKTDPDTLTAAWVALDDVDPQNGCLHVIPGSHCEPVHPHETPADPAQRIYVEVPGARDREEIAVPLKKGSGVFFPGHLLHRSGNNNTDRRRRAFVIHYGSAQSRWLNDPNAKNPFLLVCGREHPGCL